MTEKTNIMPVKVYQDFSRHIAVKLAKERGYDSAETETFITAFVTGSVWGYVDVRINYICSI